MRAILYHPKVREDLLNLGSYEAQRVLKAIKERLSEGEPDKVGKPLSGLLTGYRQLRTGDIRVVYRNSKALIEVYVLAIGPRRDDEIYALATKRFPPSSS